MLKFLTKLFGQKRFITLDESLANRARQLEGVPQVLAQLKSKGVDPAAERKEVDFFFYTDSRAKATKLQEQLTAYGYKPAQIDRTEKYWALIGQTEPMVTSQDNLSRWVSDMCRLAQDCDCEFDGWGMSA